MRLIEKVKEPLPHYGTKNIQFDLPKIVDKLGQLEDILEKYEIDDLNVLDQVLENQRFLSNRDYSTLPREDFDGLFERLNQYEDIEEELGIDLITLFKALKNGIWIYDTNGIEMFTGHFQNGLVFNYCSYPSIQYVDRLFYLKDYGKTWALTMEELKDE